MTINVEREKTAAFGPDINIRPDGCTSRQLQVEYRYSTGVKALTVCPGPHQLPTYLTSSVKQPKATKIHLNLAILAADVCEHAVCFTQSYH